MVGLRRPDEVLGIEPRSAIYKAGALPAALLLQCLVFTFLSMTG